MSLPIKVSNRKFLAQVKCFYDELLSSVPCATLCPIRNGVFMMTEYNLEFQDSVWNL